MVKCFIHAEVAQKQSHRSVPKEMGANCRHNENRKHYREPEKRLGRGMSRHRYLPARRLLHDVLAQYIKQLRRFLPLIPAWSYLFCRRNAHHARSFFKVVGKVFACIPRRFHPCSTNTSRWSLREVALLGSKIDQGARHQRGTSVPTPGNTRLP